MEIGKASWRKINIDSTEHEGTDIRLIFYKGYEHLRHYSIVEPNQELPAKEVVEQAKVTETPEKLQEMIEAALLQRILIVEDNDELRSYLATHLQELIPYKLAATEKKH